MNNMLLDEYTDSFLESLKALKDKINQQKLSVQEKGHHGMGLHVRPLVGGNHGGGGGGGGGGGARMEQDATPKTGGLAVNGGEGIHPSILAALNSDNPPGGPRLQNARAGMGDLKLDNYMEDLVGLTGIAANKGSSLEKIKDALPKRAREEGEQFSPTPELRDLQKGGSALEWLYVNDNGEIDFSPERKKLHDQIVAYFVNGVIPSKNPTVIKMGGGTAAGKSSSIKEQKITTGGLSFDEIKPNGPKEKTSTVAINPDDVKAFMPEFIDMAKRRDPQAAAYVHEESSYIARRIKAAAMEAGANLLDDGVGNGSVAKIAKEIDGYRAAGYGVVGNYITVPALEAIRRSKGRYDHGDEIVDFNGETIKENGKPVKVHRFVPNSIILSSHANVANMALEVAPLFDSFRLVDNSDLGSVPKGRAAGLRVLAKSEEKGGPVIVAKSAADMNLDSGVQLQYKDGKAVVTKDQSPYLMAFARRAEVSKVGGQVLGPGKFDQFIAEIAKFTPGENSTGGTLPTKDFTAPIAASVLGSLFPESFNVSKKLIVKDGQLQFSDRDLTQSQINLAQRVTGKARQTWDAMLATDNAGTTGALLADYTNSRAVRAGMPAATPRFLREASTSESSATGEKSGARTFSTRKHLNVRTARIGDSPRDINVYGEFVIR